MWLDTLITITILVVLALAVWSKMSHQTIPEIISGIVDLIKEWRENASNQPYLTIYE